MSSRLVFKAGLVAEIAMHARDAAEHRPWADGTEAPALMLVHDEGVYLMSNGLGKNQPDPVYAEGLGPDNYEECRAAVGGDDFVDYLGLEGFELLWDIEGPNYETVEIVLTDTTIDVQLTYTE